MSTSRAGSAALPFARLRPILTTALVASIVGCGPPDPERAPGGDSADATDEPRSAILVSAAASLSDAFAEVGSSFEAAHPGMDVVLNLGGSSSLVTQILEGAPIDVFASADRETMDRVVEAGEAFGAPRSFGRNRLRIAVPRGNPAGITGLRDFADPALLIGLCAEDVPCGRFARRTLARARVAPSLDTNEPDVRALLTKIELGELDAGITYVTDVMAAGGRVEGIEIPDSVNIVVDYPIARLAHAPDREGANAFVAFVLSEEGRAILERHGFLAP
jgi:molybdate transport system substrate-binding protein